MNNLTRSLFVFVFITSLTTSNSLAQTRNGAASTPSSAAPAKEILTNAAVIELSQLGLSEAVILEKMRQSDCRFDTSVNGIKQLKNAKVSNAVIEAMLNPHQTTISRDNPPPVVPAKNDKPNMPPTSPAGLGNSETSSGVRNVEGKGPLEVTVRGTLAQVKSVLKQHALKEEGTALERESESQLVFRTRLRELADFMGTVFVGGKNTNLTVFTFNELQENVVVVADAMSVTKNRFGNESETARLINNKKARQYMTNFLLQVKGQAEGVSK